MNPLAGGTVDLKSGSTFTDVAECGVAKAKPLTGCAAQPTCF